MRDIMSGQVTEILLQKIRFGIAHRISAIVAQSLRLDIWTDTASEDIVLSVQGFLYGENTKNKITKTVSFRHPATWWDHFKRDALPRKVRRFFSPPKYENTVRRVTWEQVIAFPKLDKAIDPSQRYPRISVWEELGSPQ